MVFDLIPLKTSFKRFISPVPAFSKLMISGLGPFVFVEFDL